MQKIENLLTDIRKNFNFLWTHCEFAFSARAFGAPDTYIQDVIRSQSESEISSAVVDELIIFSLAETMQRLADKNEDAKLKLCLQHNLIDYRVIKAINILATIPLKEKLEAEILRADAAAKFPTYPGVNAMVKARKIFTDDVKEKIKIEASEMKKINSALSKDAIHKKLGEKYKASASTIRRAISN